MMGSLPAQFPISLPALSSKDEKAFPLSSLISRINNERGSFRGISEGGLLEELRKDDEVLGSDDDDDESETEAEDIEHESNKLNELIKARGDILGQLDEAHNAAMVTLDFVSLLLSKDTPVQASLSISQSLREVVSLGTLGADKLYESRVANAQRLENRRIAKGWKLQSLTGSVNSILSSATRLEKEIEKETQYWEQILAVSESGWAVCRLPQEPHTLGVRFGFAESAPAFNNRSLGALRRNVDGTISLDQGTVDTTSRRVRIRIQTNGVTTGESSLLQDVENPTSIETSILIARNSIFEEELWQELNREARKMANHGVRLIGDEVVCGINGNKKIVLDLQSAEDTKLEHRSGTLNDDDTAAEIVSVSLRLLLSYAHRQNHYRRSRPPIPITNLPSARSSYNLLRPVVMRFHHEAIISSLKSLLDPLSRTLRIMGVCELDYTLTIASLTSNIEAIMKSLKHPRPLPEQVIEALISHVSAEFTVPLTELPFTVQSLTIQLVTPLSSLETLFRITVTGPLNVSCKPPPNSCTIDEVRSYLLWATACALAGAFVDLDEQSSDHGATSASQKEDLGSGLRGWELTHNPNILRKTLQNDKDSKELAFMANFPAGNHCAVEIKAMYKYIDGQDVVGRDNEDITHIWDGGVAIDKISVRENGEEQRHVQLRQFVENVGKWSKQSKDNSHESGGSYEATGMEWA